MRVYVTGLEGRVARACYICCLQEACVCAAGVKVTSQAQAGESVRRGRLVCCAAVVAKRWWW